MALPSGYKRLEYIQSTGTQYIDTGVSSANGFHAVFDIDIQSASSTQAIIGSHDTASPYNRNYLAVRSNQTWEIGYYDFYNFGSFAFKTKYHIDMSTISGSIFCKIDGVAQTLTTPSSAARSTRTIFVLAMNYGNTPLPCSAKLYGLKLYTSADTTALVRDFIPAIRTSDSVAGLYDLKNNVFYTNAGSGAFSYAYPPIGPSRMLLSAGTGYDIKGGKARIGGTAYSITNGRTLVGGTGYDIKFPAPLSDLGVGSSVFLNVNGASTEFLVVHHGNPDTSIYDSSCDGVWILMKNAWNTIQLNTSHYADSNAHSSLNNDFIPLLDAGVRDTVKSVKIPRSTGPYYDADYNEMPGKVFSGANGLSTKAFSLAVREVFYSSSMRDNVYPKDGALLDYFANATNDTRILKNPAGTSVGWWLRSPDFSNIGYVWSCNTSGQVRGINRSTSRYTLRPAMIFPYDTAIDDANNIIG